MLLPGNHSRHYANTEMLGCTKTKTFIQEFLNLSSTTSEHNCCFICHIQVVHMVHNLNAEINSKSIFDRMDRDARTHQAKPLAGSCGQPTNPGCSIPGLRSASKQSRDSPSGFAVFHGSCFSYDSFADHFRIAIFRESIGLTAKSERVVSGSGLRAVQQLECLS